MSKAKTTATAAVKTDGKGTKPVGKPVGKPNGYIVYNKFLNSWRCVNARGRTVMSANSLKIATAAYPDFVVKGDTNGGA